MYGLCTLRQNISLHNLRDQLARITLMPFNHAILRQITFALFKDKEEQFEN